MTDSERLQVLKQRLALWEVPEFRSSQKFPDWQAEVLELLQFDLIISSEFKSAAGLVARGPSWYGFEQGAIDLDVALRRGIAKLESKIRDSESAPKKPTENAKPLTAQPKTEPKKSKPGGDKWNVVRNLGEGGQAHTFVVKQRGREEEGEFVLKRLKNPTRVDRFSREIQAVRRLSHSGIIRIVDQDLSAAKPFFVTEYCALGSLADQKAILEGPIFRRFQVFLEVAEAVALCHQNSIVHRDIKPDNVFIRTNGTVALGDFGICFDLADDEQRLTETSEAVGARLFMAPELEDGRLDDIGPAADVYSLGKLLYWLLSGGNVFSREKHRDPKFDLCKLSTAQEGDFFEHMNGIFDDMIVHDPKRRAPLRDLILRIRRAERLIALEYASPEAAFEDSRCRSCGVGTSVVANDFILRNFGIRGSGSLRIKFCNWCGHVDLFRPDLADEDSPAGRRHKAERGEGT